MSQDRTCRQLPLSIPPQEFSTSPDASRAMSLCSMQPPNYLGTTCSTAMRQCHMCQRETWHWCTPHSTNKYIGTTKLLQCFNSQTEPLHARLGPETNRLLPSNQLPKPPCWLTEKVAADMQDVARSSPVRPRRITCYQVPCYLEDPKTAEITSTH
jgi:hypothetical protein